MINIFIEDPLNLISKSQKIKLKEYIKNNQDKLNTKNILERIHFTTDKYINVDIEKNEEDINLKFNNINKREELLFKLREKRQANNSKDPRWIMYNNFKRQGVRLANGDELPNPTFIEKNKELFLQVMNSYNGEKNPYVEYITLCCE
jgi:hypothetical protein